MFSTLGMLHSKPGESQKYVIYSYRYVITACYFHVIAGQPPSTIEHIAGILKPDLEQRMKIQKTPWVESDVVDMERLYTRLRVEKHTNTGSGIERENIVEEGLDEYENLFQTETQRPKQILVQEMGSGNSTSKIAWAEETQTELHVPERILIKGDPGIGKSTFLKKIAWDWAKGIFKAFKLIFIIFVNAIVPKESIENTIVQQNPILQGKKVDKGTIEKLLNEQGNDILLLLDGYDELSDGVDVVNELLQKRSFRNAALFLHHVPM